MKGAVMGSPQTKATEAGESIDEFRQRPVFVFEFPNQAAN